VQRLTRYFAAVSLVTLLVSVLVAAGLLVAWQQHVATADLRNVGERNNVTLSQLFLNSVWPELAPWISAAAALDADEVRKHRETARLHEAVLQRMGGLAVAKVKIYSLDGRTIFSTEASQIGENKSENPGFMAAREGRVASVLAHRDRMDTFEGTIVDRDLLASYIPVRRDRAGPVEAVFEIYTDVTEFMRDTRRSRDRLLLGTAVVSAALYLMLLLFVRHADRIIRAAQQAGERDRARLVEANARLQREIEEAARTAAELRRAEASNRLLASVVEQSGDAIYTRDLDGRITSWNKGAERLYGWTAEEAIGQPLGTLNLAKLKKDEIDEIRARIRSGRTTAMEVTNIKKSGEDVHVAITTAALCDSEGKHVGENIVARDISERKRVQAELKRANEELEARVAERTRQLERANLELQTEISERHHAVEELAGIEALLRSIMDSIPAMITFVDSEERYRFFNRRFGNWVRLSAGEIRGRTIEEVMGKEEYAVIRPHVEKALAGSGTTFERTRQIKGGDLRYYTSDYVPHIGVNGKITGFAALVVDITERKLMEQELRESAARNRVLATMVEQSTDAIHARDLDGNVTYWNGGAERIHGYSAAEAIGQPLRSLHLRDLSDAELANVLARVRSGKPHAFEAKRLTKSGQTIDAAITTAPLFDEQGRHYGEVQVLRDVTAQKTGERELRSAKEAAEAASRAKSEFLANMSHEIRTPLNGMLGMTELLLDTDLNAEQRQYLSLVMSSGRSLLAVINDVLDFSRIEAGKLKIERIEFAPVDLIAEVLKTLALRAHDQGLELIYNVPEVMPATLLGDPGRLRQILVNLVGNAIKFTERGEVEVTVRLEASTHDCAHLRVSVRDTGIGISAEAQHAIFESFTQADAGITRRYGGTGLGLAICARLCALMGGRIWVESVLGRGSTFHFTVECGTVRNPAPARRAFESPGDIRVLIVDDNPTYREVLTLLLANWGIRSEAAPDGATALAMLTQGRRAARPYSMVLLDVIMPGMDGIAVAERIKRNPELAEVALIMHSAVGYRNGLARSRALGVAAYLTKPIKPSELLDAMFTITAGRVGETARLPSPSSRSIERRPGFSILLAEDNEVNQLLASRVLEKLGHRVTIANNGEEAVAALAREHIDLILLDVQMPVMGGFEAAAAIRAEEADGARRIPIIALTANAMDGDRERCLAVGMDDHLSKPFTARELEAALQRWLPAHPRIDVAESNGDAEESAAIDDHCDVALTATTPADVLDHKALASVRALRKPGAPDLLEKVINVYLKDAPALLAALRGGLQRNDFALAHRAAHTLKSSSATLGASALAEACKAAERATRDEDHAAAQAKLPVIEAELERALTALRDEVAK
jgi:two-component system sensor histidine kinase/response regulator